MATPWFVGDPTADTTVLGPANDTAVLSLVVGSGDMAATSTTTLDLNNAMVTVTRGTTIRSDGVLAGQSTVVGNIYNDGVVNPGNSPGRITIDGDYVEAGTFIAELGGLEPGSEHDVLDITGHARFLDESILRIELLDGFVPDFGDTFTIMTFASRSGVFDLVDGFFLPDNKRFVPIYGESNLVLQIVPEPSTLVLLATLFCFRCRVRRV